MDTGKIDHRVNHRHGYLEWHGDGQKNRVPKGASRFTGLRIVTGVAIAITSLRITEETCISPTFLDQTYRSMDGRARGRLTDEFKIGFRVA